MFRLILIISFSIFFSCPSYAANTTTSDRRLEEEKRSNLQPTETIFEEDQAFDASGSLDMDVFFEQLLEKEWAFVSDGLQVLVILLGEELQIVGFESQMNFFQTKRYLSLKSAEKMQPQDLLRKGLMAEMLVKVLEIRGGLHMMLWGVTPRYAIKELVHEGIMFSGAVNEGLSGKELIYMLKEAADYIDERAK
ncbi:hypothetical protein ACFL49_02045 [Candidatus Omnitrophota bacterium]